MLKGKIFGKLKKYFEEYLFGFDQSQLQMSFITGNVDLKNVNIRPDKINEIFNKQKMPIALKAGLISKLNIKLNLLNLFSESLKITVEDILFIVGPNINHMSQESDFDTDMNCFDENNPINNILKMHQKMKKKQMLEDSAAKEHAKANKEKQRAKMKEKIAKKKKEAGELKEPPMKMIINLLGGLKLEIKRIHFRYEDDYFQHHRPFAFGLMIEQIIMDNSETDWTFDSPLSMGFVRNRPVNSSTMNKELNVKNIKVYWNSMSEMFVPTSVWEQTRHLKFQIFEALEASFLKDIMIDAFSENSKMHFNYLVQPFTVYTSINLTKSFRPLEDPYKYQINTLISAINLNFTPNTVRDILKFKSFIEMFSYSKDLKRFRPPLRIQSFIDTPAYTPQNKKKRAQCIREWWRMVIWYVRLRKVSKGYVPYTLVQIEEIIQASSLNNALLKVKKARLEDQQPYYGSEDEDHPDYQSELETPKMVKRATDVEIDMMKEMERAEKEQKKKQFIKDLLGGFKFTLKLETFRARIYGQKQQIRRQHKELPMLEFEAGILGIALGIQNQHIVAKVLIKEVQMIDYYKREQMRAFSRQVHNITGHQYDEHRSNGGRATVAHQQDFNQRPQAKQSFFDVKGAFNALWGGASGAQYKSPTKGGMRLTDIIYGKSASQSQSRANMQSRQINPNDYFMYDIPDPSQAQNRTRETMTINDILSSATSRPTTSQFNGGVRQARFTEASPLRGNKIVKAQKFQSPIKPVIEKDNLVMKHSQLNQRSETFVDDQLESVDKRCFFLLCGSKPIDSAITIDVAVNAFDEAGVKKKIQVQVSLENKVIEYSNEILKGLTNLGIQYKVAFNFSDLKNAPKKNKLNRKRCLQRMVELNAPLYVLKKAIIKRSMKVSDEQVIAYQKHWYIEREKAKSHSQKQKEAKEKQFEMVEKIKKIDQQLDDLNFDIGISLKSIYIGISSDKDDALIPHSTLLEFGINNQSISLTKEDFKCKVSVFGISVTTLNSFEMLFTFANKLKKVAGMYKENLAIQTSLQHYKEFIKNLQKHKEKEEKQRKIEEEKEFMRKSSQPKIIVNAEPHRAPPAIPSHPNNQVKVVSDYNPIKQKISFQEQHYVAHVNSNNIQIIQTAGSGIAATQGYPQVRQQPTLPLDSQKMKSNPNFNNIQQPANNKMNQPPSFSNHGPSMMNNMRMMKYQEDEIRDSGSEGNLSANNYGGGGRAGANKFSSDDSNDGRQDFFNVPQRKR